MRKAKIFIDGVSVGELEELGNKKYKFSYYPNYQGAPISLTMPVAVSREYEYNDFPPFFEGLLPEGVMLEAILRKNKLDKKDYFGQLMVVGQDVVGAVTIEEVI